LTYALTYISKLYNFTLIRKTKFHGHSLKPLLTTLTSPLPGRLLRRTSGWGLGTFYITMCLPPTIRSLISPMTFHLQLLFYYTFYLYHSYGNVALEGKFKYVPIQDYSPIFAVEKKTTIYRKNQSPLSFDMTRKATKTKIIRWIETDTE
jgi:hypothetical protein